jgi:hypothetical protein
MDQPLWEFELFSLIPLFLSIREVLKRHAAVGAR